MASDVGPTPPRFWPLRWVREESFWRDVATRTAAGIIVAFLIWGVGVAIGAFQSPDAVQGFINALLLLMAVAFGLSGILMLHLAASRQSVRWPESKDDEPGLPRWALVVEGIGSAAVGVGASVEFVSRLITGEFIILPLL
jgi:hypothetical protein